jgi:EAL and modified HD-GYP domain-containing signal transduction protein
MQVMQLLARLHNANISTGKLEDIIGCDPVLSYKTLKLINSAYHRTAARIESLGRAITYLGTDQIRALASLLALATLSDKPLALKSQTLMRARTCELLGTRARPGPPSFRRACYQPWMLTSTNRSTSP